MRHYLVGLALLCAPHATAWGQDVTEYAYYDLYGAGYEPGNFQDDWFYDYFALGDRDAAYAYGFTDYDYARGRFAWEDEPSAESADAGAPSDPPPSPEDRAFSPAAILNAPAAKPPICAESETEWRRRMNAVRAVRGRIVRTKTVSIRDAITEGEDARENMDLHTVVAMVAPDDGRTRLVVDLGPLGQMEPHVLRPGQRIAAEGVVKRLGDRQFLVAQRVTTADGHVRAVDRQAQDQMVARALERPRSEPAGAPQDPSPDAVTEVAPAAPPHEEAPPEPWTDGTPEGAEGPERAPTADDPVDPEPREEARAPATPDGGADGASDHDVGDPTDNGPNAPDADKQPD